MSGMIRSIATLAAGGGIAQAVSFLAAPVLSRVFDPAAFGVFGLFLSAAAVVGVVACWRLELAVVIPEEDAKAEEVLVASVFATLVTAGAIALLVAFAATPIAAALGESGLATLLALLPAYAGALGVFQALNYYFTRSGMFSSLAWAQVSRSSTAAGAQTGLGLAGTQASGLVLGHVAGQVVSMLVLTVRLFFQRSHVFQRAISFRRLRELISEYREFVAYGTPQALLNALNHFVPVVALAAFFGPDVAGIYLMTTRIMTAPVNLVGQAVRQVLYPELSRAFEKGDADRIGRKMTWRLAALAVLPVVLVFAFGPELFAWLLGEEWRASGAFARYLGFWLAVAFANIPAVSLIPILRMQRWHAAYEVVYLLARLVALYVGSRTGQPIVAVAAFAAVGVVFNLVVIVVPLLRTKRLLHSRT